MSIYLGKTFPHIIIISLWILSWQCGLKKLLHARFKDISYKPLCFCYFCQFLLTFPVYHLLVLTHSLFIIVLCAMKVYYYRQVYLTKGSTNCSNFIDLLNISPSKGNMCFSNTMIVSLLWYLHSLVKCGVQSDQ